MRQGSERKGSGGIGPVWAGRVEALRQAGQMDDAIAILTARVADAPSDVTARVWLGETLLAANRPDLALDAFAGALRAGEPVSGALCGQGSALAALGRPAEAARAFSAAVGLDAQDARARYGLALLAFEAGDLEAAAAHVAWFGGAGPPPAVWLAARVALARGDLAGAATIVQRLALLPGLDQASRAEALLLEAEILDRQGAAARAFAAAAAGKAMQRALHAPRAAQHEAETAKLERLAAWFSTADPAPWTIPAPGAKDEAAGHVFLLGFPRSGTTLLEQALAGHSRVIALEEAPTLADHYQTFLASPEGFARLAKIGADDAQHWRDRYWASVRAHGVEPAGRILLDKAPAGTRNLPVIAKLFPKARVLFAIRDPRDVVLSCHMSAFQMNALTYAFTDLAETARCYAACMALAEIYRAVLPMALMEVRHEHLVADFGAGLDALSAFVGIDREPAMDGIARTAANRVIRTPSAARLRDGLSAERLGRWRAYAAELARVREVLAPWVARYGYPAV